MTKDYTIKLDIVQQSYFAYKLIRKITANEFQIFRANNTKYLSKICVRNMI